MKLLLILSIIILVFILLRNSKEHFIDSNFKLCKEGDCACLKMNTAPDGACVKYDVTRPPLIPEYENKKVYQPHVVRNNLYPKKKNNIIMIFVGVKMKNEKKNYDNLVSFLAVQYILFLQSIHENFTCRQSFTGIGLLAIVTWKNMIKLSKTVQNHWSSNKIT